MRIGIDATCWANGRGYGRFTRELVTAMAPLASDHDLVCFLDGVSAEVFTLHGPNIRPVVVEQHVAPTVAATTGGRRSAIDMFRLTMAVRRARLDAFFSPSVYSYFPLPVQLPAVVTVHDAIAERFPALTLPTWRDRLFWRMKVGLALRQAGLVLTVSDYAAQEIALHLGIPRSRIRVSLEGVADTYRPSASAGEVDAAAARAGVPPGARWITYVGGFGPHKCVDVLVRAHAAVARRHPAPALVLLLAGQIEDGFHSDVSRIRSVIAESGSSHLVKWIGYQPDDELRHLHSGAVALVLASVSEGFGLPAVEAARCGAPVIATTASPLPQLLDGGGVFIPPGNQAALEAALDEFVTNEPRRLAFARRALDRASLLNWSRSAQVALSAIQEVASAPRRSTGYMKASAGVDARS